MRILVCVKQVPDPNVVTPRVDPTTRRLVRTGVQVVLDPGDEVALEEGLRLAERTEGSSITVISMGPQQAADAVRRALAMGADSAVLITDSSLEGADTLTTAKALAAAVKRHEFDIIFCGTESTDGSTGLVPGMLAELLGVPHLSFIRKLEVNDRMVTAHRATERGYQVVECALPVVVGIAGGTNEPRYPALKGLMASKRKPLDSLDVAALGLSEADTSPSERVIELLPAEERQAGEIITDEGDGATRIADFLQKSGLL